jgi:hypothetical protein
MCTSTIGRTGKKKIRIYRSRLLKNLLVLEEKLFQLNTLLLTGTSSDVQHKLKKYDEVTKRFHFFRFCNLQKSGCCEGNSGNILIMFRII